MLNTTSLVITSETLNLISQIDEFKGAWRALGTLAPDRLTALRKVATIESIGSSTRIEGSKLSDREVEQLLSRLELRSLDTRDQQEVAGYADVMDLVFTSHADIPLAENGVRQLHQMLLKHSEKDGWHRGNYKDNPNRVVARDDAGKTLAVILETASPFDTPRLMAELFDWLDAQRSSQALHPLLIAAIFTVTFLEIHPFEDGNGRLSRILTTLLLLKSDYVYVPYSSLESVIELSKDAYYRALRQTQITIRTDAPDWQPWINFFLTSLREQVRRLERKIERERIILTILPEMSLHILDLVKEHGRITIGHVARLTGANRNTLKGHLRNLVERGHLVQQGSRGRGVWYQLKG